FHFVLVTDFWCALFQPVGEHRNLHSFPTRRSSDLHVARLLGDDAVVSLGLDARKLQLLPEDLGQLVEADVDLEEVMAGGVAGLALAIALCRTVAGRSEEDRKSVVEGKSAHVGGVRMSKREISNTVKYDTISKTHTIT